MVDKVTSDDNNTNEWLYYSQGGDMASGRVLNRGTYTNKYVKRVFHQFCHYLLASIMVAKFSAYEGWTSGIQS